MDTDNAGFQGDEGLVWMMDTEQPELPRPRHPIMFVFLTEDAGEVENIYERGCPVSKLYRRRKGAISYSSKKI